MDTKITLAQFRRWLIAYERQIAAAETHLTTLDAAIGDADHGINMQRGMARVGKRLQTLVLTTEIQTLAQDGAQESRPAQDPGETRPEEVDDIGGLLRTVAMTLISSVGGAAGPLYGAFFLWAAKSAGRERAVTLDQLAAMMRMGLEGIQQRGKAQPGEKTMIDVLSPAVLALEQAAAETLPLRQAFDKMVHAAENGMQKTVKLQATKGRASYLGPRSIGHMDPGAASAFLLLRTAAETLCPAAGASDAPPAEPIAESAISASQAKGTARNDDSGT